MKLCVTTCTYNRPHLLPRTIHCFQQQDHQDRCMFIYDDGGQYGRSRFLDDGRIYLYTSKDREPSLGTKRNKCFKMATDVFSKVDAVLPCDDDDMFLPWHLSAAEAALANADWSRPSVVISGKRLSGDYWVFVKNYTGNPGDQTKNRLYHPAHAFRCEAFTKAGGYPDGLSGPEDQGLMRSLERLGARVSDPCDTFDPSYVYIWGNANISGFLNKELDPDGVKAWSNLGHTLDSVELQPWVPVFDVHNLPIINKQPFARPF